MRCILNSALLLGAVALSGPAAAAGGSYDLLYSFTPGNVGQPPSTTLAGGAPGVFYGGTGAGGAHNQGTIYAFTANSAQATPLYAFAKTKGGPTALTTGPGGILYGTLQYAPKDGSVFSYDPQTNAFTTLYTFKSSQIAKTGFYPIAIAVDAKGTAFVQTQNGGPHDGGAILAIRQHGAPHVLLGLPGNGSTSTPFTLIGTALYGAICQTGNQTGSVYKLPVGGGAAQTLYTFKNGADGGCPSSAVAQAGRTTIDGVAASGGSNNHGVIYQIDVTTGAETVLFNFDKQFGGVPNALLPGKHTIYGVRTQDGGVFAFDIAKQSARTLGGKTGEQALQAGYPLPGLILVSNTLYGVTAEGGSTNTGTLFAITP